MIHILSALGITVGEMAFKETLMELAKDSAKDFAKDVFKERLKEWNNELHASALEKAAIHAVKEFLRLFEEEIDNSAGFAFIGDALKRDVKTFLANRNVRILLGKPFDPEIRQIDSTILGAIWKELHLTPLPDEFSWDDVGKQYVRAVRRIQREQGAELRSILDSQNIEATRRAVEAMAGVAKTSDLEKYKDSLHKAYGYLKLEALDRGFDHRMQLSKVFVPQQVKRGVPPRELPKDAAVLERVKKVVQQGIDILSSPEPVLPVLDESANRLVVILGDPGSGKSSLVQYLCLQWAEGERKQIPVLIELRKYASDRNTRSDFLGYLQSGASAVWQFDSHDIDTKLKSGEVLIIFDGLDEVVDRAARQTIVTEIARFSTDYDRARIIVTSRILGYAKQQLSDAGFQHFTLQDFTQSDIDAFITKWHELAFPNPDERERMNQRLRESIKESTRIRELAANPLLLTLMAILNRSQKLPNERWELYSRASEILLDKWDLNKFLKQETDRDSISLKEKLGMLRAIANYMQAAPEGLKTNLIDHDQLEKVLAQYLESLGDLAHSRALARHMMEELRERNFVLCFSGDNLYSFVHRTFLEYFCASYFRFSVVEDQTMSIDQLKDVFLKHWKEESWAEVLRLVVGMIGLPRSRTLIEALLDIGTPAAVIFAAGCFREITEKGRAQDLSKRLRDDLSKIVAEGTLLQIMSAVTRAFEVWGADEPNHQLVRESVRKANAAKGLQKSLAFMYLLAEWKKYWPNDADLAGFTEQIAWKVPAKSVGKSV